MNESANEFFERGETHTHTHKNESAKKKLAIETETETDYRTHKTTRNMQLNSVDHTITIC